MLLRTKTITRYSYSIKANDIKKKLSRYSGSSLIECFFKHNSQFRNPKIGALSNYPWCCFLALKWKFSNKENKDVLEMGYDDFVKIINRIYDLQTEAANLSAENNLFLGMRRMMINQFLYQYPDKFNYSSLIRQYIWYCEEGEYYKDEFFKLTGLKLENFYMLASYFAIISSINSKNDSELFPFKLFILHWVDLIGVSQVKAFINLISIRIEGINYFFEEHKLDNSVTMEYYQDTPMLKKPAILYDDGLVVLSKKILKAGLIGIVPDIFKINLSNYKDKFGVTLEKYTESVFDYYGFPFITPNGIKSLYAVHNLNGKSCDYIIKEKNGIVLIDCKAIEPAPFVKSTNDPEKLRQRLESSFIKGIFQCQNTAFNLSSINYIQKNDDISILIVLHRDHYIPNGSDVQDLIKPTLSDEITEKYGSLPVDLKRVYYITIDELENLLGICKHQTLTVNSFITRCAKKDSSPLTKKANIAMHMHDVMPEGVKDIEKIKGVGDLLFKQVEGSITNVSKAWDGRTEEYMSILNYMRS